MPVWIKYLQIDFIPVYFPALVWNTNNADYDAIACGWWINDFKNMYGKSKYKYTNTMQLK